MRGRRYQAVLAAALSLAAACGSHTATNSPVDAVAAPADLSDGGGADPCPALAARYVTCGISVAATYLDDCRRNFSQTSADNLAFRCSELCVYGAGATEGCDAVRARDNSRSCVACCTPLLSGGQPSCGAAPPPDAATPAADGAPPADGGGDAACHRSCAVEGANCSHQQACTDLLDCLVGCQTRACSDDCRAHAPPEAVRTLQAALDCQAGVCPADASTP